jgi:hypothetical protein
MYDPELNSSRLAFFAVSNNVVVLWVKNQIFGYLQLTVTKGPFEA